MNRPLNHTIYQSRIGETDVIAAIPSWLSMESSSEKLVLNLRLANGSTAMVFSDIKFSGATQDDIGAILQKVKLKSCKCCDTQIFDGKTCHTIEKDMCQECSSNYRHFAVEEAEFERRGSNFNLGQFAAQGIQKFHPVARS